MFGHELPKRPAAARGGHLHPPPTTKKKIKKKKRKAVESDRFGQNPVPFLGSVAPIHRSDGCITDCGVMMARRAGRAAGLRTVGPEADPEIYLDTVGWQRCRSFGAMDSRPIQLRTCPPVCGSNRYDADQWPAFLGITARKKIKLRICRHVPLSACSAYIRLLIDASAFTKGRGGGSQIPGRNAVCVAKRASTDTIYRSDGCDVLPDVYTGGTT